MYKIIWDVQNNLDLYIWDAIMYKIIWPPPKVFLAACIHQTGSKGPFKNFETKHRLCQWHLIKNITTNLISKLGSNWQSFLKNFYSCLYKTKEMNFNLAWDSLKVQFPEAVSYLKTLEKHKKKWAICFNQNVFMVKMSTT